MRHHQTIILSHLTILILFGLIAVAAISMQGRNLALLGVLPDGRTENYGIIALSIIGMLRFLYHLWNTEYHHGTLHKKTDQ